MLTKIATVLTVALMLAGASLTFAANASANQGGLSMAEKLWLDRASALDNPRNAYGY